MLLILFMEPAAEVLSEHSARCLRRLGFRCHTGTCRVTTGVLYGGLARDTIDLAGPFWQQLGPGALGYFGEVAADWCDGVAGRWDGWRHFRGMDVLAPGTGGSG